MLMLSEAGHKEAAAAAAKKEREQQRLAAQALRDGTVAADAAAGRAPAAAAAETIDGPGADGAEYVARVARGRTLFRVAAAPDMTVGGLKALLEPLCHVRCRDLPGTSRGRASYPAHWQHIMRDEQRDEVEGAGGRDVMRGQKGTCLRQLGATGTWHGDGRPRLYSAAAGAPAHVLVCVLECVCTCLCLQLCACVVFTCVVCVPV